jgi:hypothetical protein
MIHIVTLHFGTQAWFDIQKRYITKYTTGDYKVWIGTYRNEIPEDFDLPDNWQHMDLDKDYPSDGINEHYAQTEFMYSNYLRDEMKDDDVLIFIDSDAFPVTDKWTQKIQNLFESGSEDGPCDVLGIAQPENKGIAATDDYDPYPDLCFFATTKKVWEDNNLEWGLFLPKHQNPGFGMLDRIKAADLALMYIQRTNSFEANSVMFGVYGDMIYHQHCGSRAIIGRPLATNKAKAMNKRQCYTGRDLSYRLSLGNFFEVEFEDVCPDIIETNTAIFDIIYERLVKDADANFVPRYFLGRP